jgi:uncharacterized protein (DUF3820 family)
MVDGVVLRHGKYRGHDLKEVETEYLLSLANTNHEIAVLVEGEMGRRDLVEATGALLGDLPEETYEEKIRKTLSFGKHRGKNVKEVPREYLEWLCVSNREITAAIEAELRRRASEGEKAMGNGIISNGFRPSTLQCQQSRQADNILDKTEVPSARIPEVTKCAPGVAKNSNYNPAWQFTGGARDIRNVPDSDIERAKRLAREDFRPWESAILEVVLNQPGPIGQKDLAAAVTKMGIHRWRVLPTAQMLAAHGKIARKKIGRQWHYAKPGLHLAKGK